MKPPKTASPPYRDRDSVTAKALKAVRGRAIGAREESATTVIPASKGPPRNKNWLSFAVAPT